MKLREFVANSLPRVRGKKKKQTPAQRTLNNEGYDSKKNKNKTPDCKGLWDYGNNNNNCPSEGTCQYSLNQAVKSVCGEIIDTFNADSYTYRVNNSFCEDQYTCCYNDLSPYIRAEEVEKKNEALNLSSDSEKQFNTVPKTRSRIRTNPWLPSPRSTPSNSSGSSSPTSSMSTSPMSPLNNKLRLLCIKDTLSTTSSDSLMDTDHSTSSPDAPDSELSLKLDKWNGRFDLSHLPPFKEEESYVFTSWDTDASTDLSPTADSCAGNVAEPQHNVSFEYEEALDDTLEKGSVKRDMSLQDLLDEEQQKDVGVQTEFDDYNEDSDWLQDGSSDEGSTDLTNLECAKYCCGRDIMQDSTDTGYSSLGRDGQAEIDEEFQFVKPDQYECKDSRNKANSIKEEPKPAPNSICVSECVCEKSTSSESQDLAKERYVAAKYPEETSGRTLAEIKMSLEEKVFLLRQEKRIVEQKIKEAQEEDKIRQQEKMRFHRQLNIHRKQILLKTLHDLKAKLENQSDRLQDSYSAVLTMQRRFAQRNSPLLLLGKSPQ